MKTIAIVIPVFNESGNLEPLHRELKSVAVGLPQYIWRYIYVNDASRDESQIKLEELVKNNINCSVLELSRNFGKEIALTVGVHEAEFADAVICIDADLQHPPKLIPELVQKWENGFDVVITIRSATKNISFAKYFLSSLYYKLMSWISDVEITPNSTDFRLFDKKVVQIFKNVTERKRMFRGIMDWMGFKRCYVEFQAGERYSGNQSYSYKKLFQLAINSITSFSLWPLKLTGYIGLLISILGSLVLSWMLLSRLIYGAWQFSALGIFIVINTLLIGIVLISIGLVALYIATIHTEVINRPLFIIRSRADSV